MRILMAFAMLLAGSAAWCQDPPVVEPVEPVPIPVTATPLPETPIDAPVVTVEEKPSKVKGPLGPSWDCDEYLLWWLKPQSVPVLLLGSRAPGISLTSQIAATTLIGGDLKSQEHSGGRFMGGWALDDDQTIGLEYHYFFLGSRSYTQAFASDGGAGDLNLARPFVSPVDGMTFSWPVAEVGRSSGRFEMVASSRVQGAEINGLTHLWAGGHFRFDGLIGFRFLQINEGLRIAQRTNEKIGVPYGWALGLDISEFPFGYFGTHDRVTDIVDQIDGHNIFYGGQLGMRADWKRGPVFVETIGKIAFGQTNEVVKINGVQVVYNDGLPTSGHGGYYAQPTNSGRFTQSVFAVVPEVIFRAGVQHQATRLFVGYNFLYLSLLARPGDQIDERLFPPSRTFGVAESRLATIYPQFRFKQSDFWAQGVMIGLEVRY